MSTLVRRFWYDTPLIMSQLSMILVGLQLAQQLAEFTDYDAHLSNVLIQRTEMKWILYRIPVSFRSEPVDLLLPTFGHYPLFIDYGRSHSVSVSRKPSAVHYSLQHQECGIQTAVFDAGYDVHHVLFYLTHMMQVDEDLEESRSRSGSEHSETEDDSGSDSNRETTESNSDSEHEQENERKIDQSEIETNTPRSNESDVGGEQDGDEEPGTNYRPHCSEELLDLTIRMYKSLPIDSASGRRMYAYDVCEELFATLQQRLPEAEMKSYWLWNKWGPMIFDQLGVLMKPLTPWGTSPQSTPLPKNPLSEEGMKSVLEGIPVHKSFRVMMSFLCVLLPEPIPELNEQSEPSPSPPPLITRRTYWYSAIFSQWAELCLETLTAKYSASQLADHFKSRLSAVGLDHAPLRSGCTVQWTASKLDWVAAAHHTYKFAEHVHRMADVLLRVNVEETEECWSQNTAGRIEPIDIVLQFTPTWVSSQDHIDLPQSGDRVLVCDGVQRTSYEYTLDDTHVSEHPTRWLDWGSALVKRLSLSNHLTDAIHLQSMCSTAQEEAVTQTC
jgi:hypothetical protein